jgi:hypothetical protein
VGRICNPSWNRINWSAKNLGYQFGNPGSGIAAFYMILWLTKLSQYYNPLTEIPNFSDYKWSLLNEPSCNDYLCENGGVCLPQSSGAAKCLCQPGFTGNNCDTKMSSCAENPCLNDANCTEDPSGGTGYRCECEGTNRRGRHCEKVCMSTSMTSVVEY